MTRELAEQRATEMFPQGCMCPNNGAADCDWCEAVSIGLDADEEISVDDELKALAGAQQILYEAMLKCEPIDYQNPIWRKLFDAKEYLTKRMSEVVADILGDPEVARV